MGHLRHSNLRTEHFGHSLGAICITLRMYLPAVQLILWGSSKKALYGSRRFSMGMTDYV